MEERIRETKATLKEQILVKDARIAELEAQVQKIGSNYNALRKTFGGAMKVSEGLVQMLTDAIPPGN